MVRLLSLFLTVCVLISTTITSQRDTESHPESVAGIQTTVRSPSLRLKHDELVNSLEETDKLFPGKIGLMTGSGFLDDISYLAAKKTVKKYGFDNFLWRTWSVSSIDTYSDIDRLEILVNDSEVDSILINPSRANIHNILRGFRESRDDTFYICIDAMDDLGVLSSQADIVLVIDKLYMGKAMVRQAKKMGAETFVHYSYSRHIDKFLYSERRELMRKECENLGMTFLDIKSIDPANDGIAVAREFFQESVLNIIKEYGNKTAFFSLCFYSPNDLLKQVIGANAIFVQTNSASPYHGFSETFGIEFWSEGELIPHEILNNEIKKAVAQENMTGRISNWPVDPNAMLTEVSIEYAIKRQKGEAPQEGIDVELLAQMMADYAGVKVYLTPYTDLETGETYENVLMMRMDYIKY